MTRAGRDLPLPLLVLLAVGAVAAERLGRRGLLAIIPALLVCVLLASVGPRLAGQSSDAPLAAPTSAAAPTQAAAPAANVAPAPTTAAIAPTAAPAAPTAAAAAVVAPTVATPTIPVNAGGDRAGGPTPAPTVQPTAAAQVALAPVAAATSAAPAAPAAPPAKARDTTVIPILMYHYVRVVNDPKDQVGINLSVTPTAFAAQMKYLADKGYTTLTMREVHAILAGEQPLPPKPIALTFDDGYRDFYAAAWPVLRQYGFKATNYVITDFIGWDAYMTWPMLQELDASGQVEIGAHTRSHSDLRAQKADRRWDEIAGSKAILEEGLGRPVTAFCYPAGFYNAAALADVKRAQYLTAVTTQAGAKQNLQWAYELPRIRVNGPDPLGTWAGKLP